MMTEVQSAYSLEVDSRVAGAGEVDSGEVRIGGGDVRVAGSKRGGLEFVAGVQGAELEVAARFRLQHVDEIAGGIELEIAVRLGDRKLARGRGAGHRG